MPARRQSGTRGVAWQWFGVRVRSHHRRRRFFVVVLRVCCWGHLAPACLLVHVSVVMNGMECALLLHSFAVWAAILILSILATCARTNSYSRCRGLLSCVSACAGNCRTAGRVARNQAHARTQGHARGIGGERPRLLKQHFRRQDTRKKQAHSFPTENEHYALKERGGGMARERHNPTTSPPPRPTIKQQSEAAHTCAIRANHFSMLG